MTIDPRADRAVYKQLADLIRTEIENGEYDPGQRLPAQKDYMQEHYLSRDTVERAMAILRTEGLIITDRRGSRVRPVTTPTTLPVRRGKISARMPTEPERNKLDIEQGTPVLVVKLAGHNDEIYPADQIEIEIDPDQLQPEVEAHRSAQLRAQLRSMPGPDLEWTDLAQEAAQAQHDLSQPPQERPADE